MKLLGWKCPNYIPQETESDLTSAHLQLEVEVKFSNNDIWHRMFLLFENDLINKWNCSSRVQYEDKGFVLFSTQSKAHSLWCRRLRNTEEKNCNSDPYLRQSIDSVRAECMWPEKDSVGKCNQYHLKARDIQKECDLRSRMTETLLFNVQKIIVLLDRFQQLIWATSCISMMNFQSCFSFGWWPNYSLF